MSLLSTFFPSSFLLVIAHLGSHLCLPFPDSVGNLRSLKKLFLRYNKLTRLPAEIGQLKLLEVLSVRNNRLSSLIPEINNLTCLEVGTFSPFCYGKNSISRSLFLS